MLDLGVFHLEKRKGGSSFFLLGEVSYTVTFFNNFHLK